MSEQTLSGPEREAAFAELKMLEEKAGKIFRSDADLGEALMALRQRQESAGLPDPAIAAEIEAIKQKRAALEQERLPVAARVYQLRDLLGIRPSLSSGGFDGAASMLPGSPTTPPPRGHKDD